MEPNYLVYLSIINFLLMIIVFAYVHKVDIEAKKLKKDFKGAIQIMAKEILNVGGTAEDITGQPKVGDPINVEEQHNEETPTKEVVVNESIEVVTQEVDIDEDSIIAEAEKEAQDKLEEETTIEEKKERKKFDIIINGKNRTILEGYTPYRMRKIIGSDPKVMRHYGNDKLLEVFYDGDLRRISVIYQNEKLTKIKQ